MIIDVHTHIFPQELAAKAVQGIEEAHRIKACLDGTLSSLLNSMDRGGVAKSVVCNIATRPTQFEGILNWSKVIRSERIEPLGSLHPHEKNIPEKIRILYNEGFRGIKLHPDFQDFSINEECMFPIYSEILNYGMFIICHTGIKPDRGETSMSDAAKIVEVYNRFPGIKFIAAHMGGFMDWDAAEKHLIGKPYYLDTSFTCSLVGEKRFKDFLKRHPKEYLFMGSDSPWQEQKAAVKQIKDCAPDEETAHELLSNNARKQLNL